jgi:hypothetical protein
MHRFFENLQHQAEENPVVALGVGATLIAAISKLLDAQTNARNSKTWDKEVRRRDRKTK